MDLGEAVAVSIASDLMDAAESVCNITDEPVEAENDLTDDFEETEDDSGYEKDGQVFANDAAKLGKNLGGRPPRGLLQLPAPHAAGEPAAKRPRPAPIEVTRAAHHLIPGNGSLKKSELFKGNYLRSDGMAKGNIGYNVNAAANGEWLPGNYAVKGWGGKPADFKTSYSGAAIDYYGCQFHTAHRDYNTFVLEVLNKIAEKLQQQEAQACPDARADPDNSPPLKFLVGRLRSLSARLRSMLVFPAAHWRQNVFTSSYSESYMKDR
jgi:hypothetical protein